MPEREGQPAREKPEAEDAGRPPSLLDRTIDLTHVGAPVWIFLGLLVAAMLLRLLDLGGRAMHPDESLYAWFSWQFYRGALPYQYDPAFHGPLLYHLTALFYFLFGESDATARLAPALAGILLVALAFPLQRWLGRWGGLAALALLALSPSFVYFSRSARPEPFVALFALGMVLFFFRYLEERRPAELVLAAACLALAVTAHEAAFLIGLILLSFLGWVYLLQVQGERFRTGGRFVAGLAFVLGILGAAGLAALGTSPALQAVLILLALLSLGYLGLSFLRLDASGLVEAVHSLRQDPRPFFTALGAFGLIFGLFFTTFLTHPRGFLDGLVRGIEYWAGRHFLPQSGGPWSYYLLLLALYEPIALTAGLAGLGLVLARTARKSEGTGRPPLPLFQAFLAYWAVFSILAFSWAGEKSPWLLLHVALPLVLLAGLALERFASWCTWRELWKYGEWAVAPLFLLLAFALRGLVSLLQGEVPHARVEEYRTMLAGVLALILLGLLAFLARRIWRSEGRRLGQSFALLGLLLLALYTARSTFLLNFYGGDSPQEMLVRDQTAPDVPLVVRQIERLSRDQTRKSERRTAADPTGGHGLRVLVDNPCPTEPPDPSCMNTLAWPFRWYLRDFAWAGTLLEFDGSQGPPRTEGDIVLVLAEHEPALRSALAAGYTGMRLKLRWGFPEEGTFRRWTLLDSGATESGYQAVPLLAFWNYSPKGLGDLWNYWLYRQLPADVVYRVQPGEIIASIAARLGVSTEKLLSLNNNNPNVVPGQALRVPLVIPGQDFYLYVRSDLLPAGPAAAAEEDPYLQKLTERAAMQVLGSPGSSPGQLWAPGGIAVDARGNLFIADSGNHRVARFDAQGNPSSWGSFCDLLTGEGCLDPDGEGPLQPGDGQFKTPWGIAVDGQGRVYVADTWNHRIQVFDGEGNFLGKWGEGVLVDTGEDATARSAHPFGFYGPRAVAVDSQGTIYVADTGNERILAYRVHPDESGRLSAEYLYQWGTTGSAPGQFLEPVGLAVDAAGRLYVADTWNMRVQVFAPGTDGRIAPQPAATWEVPGWELSTGDNNKPYIAVAPGGQVYFTVPGRNYVAATDGAGKVLLVWSGVDAQQVPMSIPVGIAVDELGRVYVSDSGNGRILIFGVP
ncbi:MAG: flippase activity-associated protein Agl23 [Chloroflexia bacterium]